MSSRPTGTSSLTQKYCCFKREPQALCSRLNEMARLASVAEKSFTGMETSPKETVNDAMERAAISYLRQHGKNAGERIVIQRNSSSFRPFQRLLQTLLLGERLAPAIASLGQAVGDVRNAEIEGMRARQFVPGQRHRYRRARGATR